MRKAFSAPQAQEIDRIAIQEFGMASCVLMEQAGRLTAQEILKILKKKKGKSVCVFCGTGNNGGDGFVVARYLFNHGAQVKVFLVGKSSNLKKDPAVNYQVLRKIECPIKAINGVTKKFLTDVARFDVIVDAIFGIGLSRKIEEPFKSIIKVINHSKKDVVAVDVPSGLDATTGKVLGISIRAALTVTFAVMKKGFLTTQGRRLTGRVKVVDIGIPRAAIKRVL